MTEKDNQDVKLTSRQKTFLARLVDIYRDIRGPVHYSHIAKQAGLCSSSAYDMLKVLEQKGMVTSQYHIPKVASGPGRASVMFLPTDKTIGRFSPEDINIKVNGEWGETKINIMNSLGRCKNCDYGKLVSNLFEQSKNMRSPLSSCAQILTALLVSMRQSKRDLDEHKLVGTMLEAPVSNPGMGSVAGLILGLSLTDKQKKDPLKNYQEFVNKYIALLQNMSQENLIMLQEFMLDVWNKLQMGAAYQY